nr:sigma-70 family RNA polymerase sigma factor [Oleiagrimonas sp. C23AA]
MKRGDMHAFEQVYRTFETPVYTLALRLTGQPDAAAEVLQDTLLKAFERAHQFRGDSPFWGWLRQMAVNEALMRLRRDKRHASEGYEDVYCDESSALPWQRMDVALVERALQQLPDATRAVLWLYHVEGYTHVEIADQFGRSVSYSKSQLARGTRRLRALLEPAAETSP